MNRELAVHNLDRESQLLKSVEEALARIDTSAFGQGPRCDEAIPESAQIAVPWASHWIRCQETLDRQRAMGELDDERDMFQSAA